MIKINLSALAKDPMGEDINDVTLGKALAQGILSSRSENASDGERLYDIALSLRETGTAEVSKTDAELLKKTIPTLGFAIVLQTPLVRTISDAINEANL